jgi:hypothetical protein
MNKQSLSEELKMNIDIDEQERPTQEDLDSI